MSHYHSRVGALFGRNCARALAKFESPHNGSGSKPPPSVVLSSTFIDLFAGIGGIRLGMEANGARCVMTSEIDKFARQTYSAFFPDDGDDHLWVNDITSIAPEDVPDHDILCGGFPCQPFSIAGVSKKNSLGRAHGFDDPTKGTLFFNIKEILRAKQPAAFLLENVKNLTGHDGGRTWRVIEQALSEVGYNFSAHIIDSALVVPQHRERVFIVGLNRDTLGLSKAENDFSDFWSAVRQNLEFERERIRNAYGVKGDWPQVGAILDSKVDSKYQLTEGLWSYLRAYKEKHTARGNGFGYSLFNGSEAYTRTISARYYKDGSEVLIDQRRERPRRLTPRECARLQGFPPELVELFGTRQQPVSDVQAYKQFGNSVSVPVISAIAKQLTIYADGGLRPSVADRVDSQLSIAL